MHGLYEPHGPGGASRFGPSGMVHCSELMRKQLTRWLSLLWSSCGASVKAALQRVELEPTPKIYLHVCSDAMYEPSVAGIGGYCHGFYWSFAVPAEALPALSIPILEFLGVVLNFLVFAPLLRRLLAANPNAAVVLRLSLIHI